MSSRDPDCVRRVRLFNEVALVLLDSTFVKYLEKEKGTSAKIIWEDGALSVDFTGPDDDSVRALVLTMRMFIQDQDGISLREMARLYADPAVPDDLRDRFNKWRDGVNAWLDAPPAPLSLNHDGAELTRRDLLDAVVYDGLAHANPAKRELYENWRAMPPFFVLVWMEFTTTLLGVSQCVRDVRDVNVDLLGRIGHGDG